MEIQLTAEQYQRLSGVAQAAGYHDAASFVVALSSEPTEDPRGLLTPDALQASLKDLAEADASIDAGGGHDAVTALRRLGLERGFGTPG